MMKRSKARNDFPRADTIYGITIQEVLIQKSN